MSLNKFCVVEFPEPDGSKSVEVVPNKWLDCANCLCYWPPRAGVNLKSKVKKLVIPKTDWTKYKFNRIFGTYDDYSTACRKCKTAEYTSNVESESNAVSPAVLSKKTCRRKVTRSKAPARDNSSDDTNEESSEIEETFPPQLPTLLYPATRIQSGIEANSVQNIEVPSTAFDFNQRQSNPQVPSSSSINKDLDGVSLGLVKDENVAPDIPESSFESSGQASCLNPRSITNSPSISLMSLDEQNNAANVLPSQADVLAVQSKLEEFAVKVFYILEKQNDEIREIKAYLHAFRQSGSTSIPDYSSIPSFPLLDLTKLDEFEDWLNLDANKHLLGEYLALIGGATVEKNTRKVLRRLFSPSLSRLINFTGKGDKRALKSLKIFSAIKAGIRIGKPTAQDDVIEQTAINWFRFSKTPKQAVQSTSQNLRPPTS